MRVRHGCSTPVPATTTALSSPSLVPRPALAGVLLQPAQAEAIITKAGLKTGGDLSALQALAPVMDAFNPHFNISTP